jgi:hypothetical protein
MNDELVILRRCSFPHEAHLLRAQLESVGIPAHVADEHLVAVNPLMSDALGSVKVLVSAEDRVRAEEELSRLDAVPSRCERCGAAPLERRYRHRFGGLLTFLLFGVPLFFPKVELRCPACDAGA